MFVIDRDATHRLGVSPQAIDDTLYDAFGQRQVSTMYTQLNQYHVVLEVEPQFQRDPASLNNFTSRPTNGPQVPLSAVRGFKTSNTRWRSTTRASFRGDDFVQPGAGRLAGRGGQRDQQGAGARSECRQSIRGSFQGTAQAFQASLATSRC